jgi:hypothetical protein
LRCAKVIPRNSSASIRSSPMLTTGSIIATDGPFRTTPMANSRTAGQRGHSILNTLNTPG